jgi:palmitoyltransferase
VVVATAIYLSEQLASPSGKWQHQLVALLILGGFFGLFTLGMAGSSLQFVFENLTTIENLSKKRHPWLLAVLVPPTFIIPKEGNYPHVTYPLPFLAHETTQIGSLASEPILSVPQHDGPGHEFEPPSERDTKATKTFAILPLGIGKNPWDLGAAGNWKSVMGNNVIDWFLPIKKSPCCNHESDESQFETGRWVEQLQVDVGFISEQDMQKPRPVSGRHENRKDIMSIPLKMRAVKPAITAEGVPRNAH